LSSRNARGASPPPPTRSDLYRERNNLAPGALKKN
jgi:hypothetical protein